VQQIHDALYNEKTFTPSQNSSQNAQNHLNQQTYYDDSYSQIEVSSGNLQRYVHDRDVIKQNQDRQNK